MTVFRMGEGSQDIDLAILTALLKGKFNEVQDFKDEICCKYAMVLTCIVLIHCSHTMEHPVTSCIVII